MVKKITKVKISQSLWEKSLGVIGWRDFGKYNGLLLTQTTAIHTFFVKMPLDVVFLDQEMKVVKILENLKPWSFSPIVWQAKHTLELPKDAVKKHKLVVGTVLQLQ